MHTLRATSPTQTPSQAPPPAQPLMQADHNAVLAYVLQHHHANTLAAITYEQIEAAMMQLSLDPFEEGDTYQQVIDALGQRGVAVVDTVQADDNGVDEDALAEEIADDVVAQLARLIEDPNEYRHPLLTAERERRLLELYHDGKRAQHELTHVDSPIQRRAAERRINAAEQALEELVRCNLRLVAHIALPVARRTQHLSLDDLVQEGKIGLCHAIEKYNLDMNMRLSTYATWWIRQSVTRAVADQDRVVRLPVHVIETIYKLAKVAYQLEAILSRAPTAIEVALQCDIPSVLPDHINFALRAAPTVYCLGGNTTQDFEDRVALDAGARHVIRFLTKAHPQNDLRQKLAQTQRTLQQHFHREPKAEEIALVCSDERILSNDIRLRLQLRPAALETGKLSYNPQLHEVVQKAAQKVLQLQSYHVATPVSLDLPISDRKDVCVGDLLTATMPRVEDDIITQELERILVQELAGLDERERLVLQLRVGLKLEREDQLHVAELAQRCRLTMPHEGECWTLEEVGRLFDVTRERIRQIEGKALKRLERRTRKYLPEFLEV